MAEQVARSREKGMSLFEAVAGLAITLILVEVAVVSVSNYLHTYRISGDAKRIAGQLALARMRSAADYDQARITVNTSARTYQLELCTKSTATFAIEGSSLSLSPDVQFGFGSITQAAGGYQATIAQTSPVTFNSRGAPITLSGASCTGCGGSCVSTVTGNNAIYLRDTQGHAYAVTVNPGGKIDIWQYQSGGWASSGF